VVNKQNNPVPLLSPTIPFIVIIIPFIDSGMGYPSPAYGYLQFIHSVCENWVKMRSSETKLCNFSKYEASVWYLSLMEIFHITPEFVVNWISSLLIYMPLTEHNSIH
jgi:hypothetical protein